MGIAPEFIVSLKGKSYPTWPGVLDAATRAGLKSLTTEIVQIPGPENGHMAVVMATAIFEDGREFVDVGDCSPQSTSPMLAAAALRLASTRAKGRVLRDACNVGQTLLEELPDTDALSAPAAAYRDQERAEQSGGRSAPTRPQSQAPARSTPPRQSRTETRTDRAPAKAEGDAGAAPICSTADCHKPLTKGQYEVSLRAYGAPLCPSCQKRAAARA